MNTRHVRWSGIGMLLGCVAVASAQEQPDHYAKVEIRGKVYRFMADPIRRPDDIEYLVAVGPPSSPKDHNHYHLDLSNLELRTLAKSLDGKEAVVFGELKQVRAPSGPREGALQRLVIKVKTMKKADTTK